MKAKARPRRLPGTMNKTEESYHWHLAAAQMAGMIEWFAFEPVKFRLAVNTSYCPDFMVVNRDGSIEFIEVKGSWKAPHQDDSKVKIKVAAELYQWATFKSAEVVPKAKGGGWKMTTFSRE